MSKTRVYQNQPLAEGLQISLDQTATHHLMHVLRAKVGDEIWLFNGQVYQGELGDFQARITAIHKKNLQVSLLHFVKCNAESLIAICLAQVLPRGLKMDFILQKACELGVKHITPLISERSQVRLNTQQIEKKSAHWQGILQHACEQSGRNCIPQLDTLSTFG